MPPQHTSRREHLFQIGLALSAIPLAAQATFTFFDPATATEIEALAAEIIPADETPGAKEAGVIYFIDRALSGFESEKRRIYKSGLAVAQEIRKLLFPESTSIATLTEEQRHKLVESIETTEFFQTLREHTAMSFFGNPEYGGNKNKVGWKLIGFEDSHMFTPPFGSYDKRSDDKQ